MCIAKKYTLYFRETLTIFYQNNILEIVVQVNKCR